MFVKTLNIADSVSNIETSTTYKYYWVRNLGAEDASVFRAFSDIDTNKKIILSQDEYIKIIPENNVIYFKSSSTGTKIEIYGTNTDICPFKIGKVKGSKDGGDGKNIINIIPLLTPDPVLLEGGSGGFSLVGDSSYSLYMSKDYSSYISGYIDVSTIVANDVLCSDTAKIRMLIELGANTTLTSTVQMYIGNEVPTENDWVTVASQQVSSGSKYRVDVMRNISDFNQSGDTDGRIYFKHIHGTESSSYTSNARIRCLQIEL